MKNLTGMIVRLITVIALTLLTAAPVFAAQTSGGYTKSQMDSFLQQFLETTASDTQDCQDMDSLTIAMYDKNGAKKNSLDMYSKLAFYSARCLMNVRREAIGGDGVKIPLIQLYNACQKLKPHILDNDYKVEKKSCTALYFAPGTHLDDPFFAP